MNLHYRLSLKSLKIYKYVELEKNKGIPIWSKVFKIITIAEVAHKQEHVLNPLQVWESMRGLKTLHSPIKLPCAWDFEITNLMQEKESCFIWWNLSLARDMGEEWPFWYSMEVESKGTCSSMVKVTLAPVGSLRIIDPTWEDTTAFQTSATRSHEW